jgi:hypothetical protein
MPNGKHGDLLSYSFLDTLHPYTELAINGNDMDHPQLLEFLDKLKERKVFANITVNQNQFMNNLEMIKRLVEEKLVYGVGVSFNHYDDKFIEEFRQLKNGVLHVINGIVKVDDMKQLSNKDIKILILGYKNVRRGSTYLNDNNDTITKNQDELFNNLETVIKEKWFNVVSFDNLAITQLDVKRLLSEEDWKEFYMGDDGKFTFYIDMVEGEFSRNSCSVSKRHKIENKSIDEMFKIIQDEKD